MARTVLSVAEEELTLVWLMQLSFARLVLRVTWAVCRIAPSSAEKRKMRQCMRARRAPLRSAVEPFAYGAMSSNLTN
jgi:hypothetical protein